MNTNLQRLKEAFSKVQVEVEHTPETITIIELGKKLAQSRDVQLIHYETPGWGGRLCWVLGKAFLEDPQWMHHHLSNLGGTRIIDYKGWLIIEQDKMKLMDFEIEGAARWWGEMWEKYGDEDKYLVQIWGNDFCTFGVNFVTHYHTGRYCFSTLTHDFEEPSKSLEDSFYIRWDYNNFDWC